MLKRLLNQPERITYARLREVCELFETMLTQQFRQARSPRQAAAPVRQGHADRRPCVSGRFRLTTCGSCRPFARMRQ